MIDVYNRSIVWIAALYTIFVFSFPFKGDNRFFRFAQASMVGAAAGHVSVMGLLHIKNNVLPSIVGGEYIFIIPMILGLLLFLRYSENLSWVSRYPIAVLVGIGIGTEMGRQIYSNVVRQLAASVLPLNSIDNIIFVFLMVSIMVYFIFTIGVKDENQGGKLSYIFRPLRSVARYGIMLGVGLYLAYTLTTRIGFVIFRLTFLIKDWLFQLP